MALLTPYWGLDGIIILMSLTVTAYLFMTRKFRYWQKRGVMELPPTPFLGNFGECFMLKKNSGQFVKDLYDQSKGLPYMGFYIFDKPCFMPRDPELIKHILTKDFSYFTDKYASATKTDRLGYTNLFLMKNPGWKMLRTSLSPIFTSGKMKKMFELMLTVADDLDSYLDSLSLEGNGKVIELKDIAANLTTDLIGTTAFGLRINSLHNPDTEFRKYGRKLFTYDFWRGFELLAIFFMPALVGPIGGKFFGNESSRYLRSVFWSTMNERIASGEKRGDFIDLLIELKLKHANDTELKDFKFDGDDLLAQAAAFFTGGFETSSTTLSFALYEMALQPEIQKTLRKEITEALEKTGGKVTYDMAFGLPYLSMVVSETLRMYPPLPFLDRVTISDYKLPNSDLVLQKGTPIYVPMIGLHYDPQYFPEPEKFKPERFNEENKRNMPSSVYFPFGDGPRTCIGMRLGLLQVYLSLIQILRKYEVTTCDKTLIPMVLEPKGLTTTALGGLYLNVRKLNTEAG